MTTTAEQICGDPRCECAHLRPVERWQTEYIRIPHKGDHTFDKFLVDGWTGDGWEPFSTFVLDGTPYVAIRRRTRP